MANKLFCDLCGAQVALDSSNTFGSKNASDSIPAQPTEEFVQHFKKIYKQDPQFTVNVRVDVCLSYTTRNGHLESHSIDLCKKCLIEKTEQFIKKHKK